MNLLRLPHFTLEPERVLFLGQHVYMKTARRLDMDIPEDARRMHDEGLIVSTLDPAPIAVDDNLILFLEPHPDDIALSCGGIAMRLRHCGARVHVLSLFPRSSLLTFPWRHSVELGEQEYWALRTTESQLALRDLLGFGYTSLEFPAASVRRDTSVFNPPTADDRALERRVTAEADHAIRALGATHVLAPMGFGQHVDHTIAHRAALTLKSQGMDVAFYEDIPYARNRLKFDASSLVGDVLYLDVAPFLSSVADLAICYRSQIDDCNRSQLFAVLREDARTIATEGRLSGRYAASDYAQRIRGWKNVSFL